MSKAPRYCAAGVVVIDSGLVLGITRGTDLAIIELPGGGIEAADPTVAYAAARETYEETGVIIDPSTLRYVDENPGPRGAYATFLAPKVRSWPKRFASEPFEGFVGFYQPEVFVQSKARHREYVRRVFEKVGLL